MQVTALVLLSLLAVVLGGALARATRWPVPLVQVALGAGLHFTPGSTVVLEPEVFFLLFLPPLLFLDGWRIPNDALRRDARAIVRLAFGLVVFTVLGLGVFIHWLIPAIPWPVAFALAAVLSPTDPTAVSAIAARSPLAPRLLHVLQGEALFNDASGLLCLRVAVGAMLTGSFSVVGALADFAWVAAGGLVVGVSATWALSRLSAAVTQRWGPDGAGQILLTLLIPFGVYLLAEALQTSGILAAAAAGVTMSATDAWRWTASTRLRRTAVWDLIQTAINGSIFVLLGSQLPALWATAPTTAAASGYPHAAWLMVVVALITGALGGLRFAWVWATVSWSARMARRQGEAVTAFGVKSVLITTLAGVRGAVTLAAVMTLPLTLTDGSPFPSRDLAVLLAAGVIMLSVVLATLVLPRVLKSLVPAAEVGPARVQRLRQAAALQAMAAIEAMGAEGEPTADPALAQAQQSASAEVIDEYRRRILRYDAQQTPLQRQHDDRLQRRARLVGLRAERAALRHMAAAQGVDDLALRRLVRDMDHLEARYLP